MVEDATSGSQHERSGTQVPLLCLLGRPEGLLRCAACPMHRQVAACELLLDRPVAVPSAREQQTLLASLLAFPQREADGVGMAGLAPVGHRHLEGQVAAQGDKVVRIGDVGQVGLRLELRRPGRLTRGIDYAEGLDGIGRDLVGAIANPEQQRRSTV